MSRTLELWTVPDSWFGKPWHDHYVFMGRHRDSQILDSHNFMTALARIGGETENTHVVRESHWAVGWVEWIAIHKSDTEAVEKAQSVLDDLDTYPILDEDGYSAKQMEAVWDYWDSASTEERIELCKKDGVSIFAARHESMPELPTLEQSEMFY